ncbi:MAG: stage II sporulation protein R [Clostridia bacterium]|nr:stage II sporulation protein R [Clostridia bacterium]
MKKLIKSMVTAVVLVSVLSFLPFYEECRNISDEVLRIHILADSDSQYDQSLKLKVRDEILKYTDGLYSHVSSKEQAVNITNEHINEIISTAENTLKANGCNKKVSAEVLDMNFNTRHYDNITMPSGNYTALRITIGSGNGKNWWCVMYPSLCLYSSSDAKSLEDELSTEQYEVITDAPKYRFKFKILEYFDYFCNLLS